MATIFTSNYSGGYGGKYEFKAEAREEKASNYISTNKTTVVVDTYVRRTDYSSNGAFNLSGTGWGITIDGSAFSGSSTWDTRNSTEWKHLGSASKEIEHNADGSKKITISASHTGNSASGSSKMGNASGSGTFTLTTIPRASSITAIDAKIESSTIININRASSNFTHTITYSFAGLTGTIATKTSSTSVGWTIPSSFYAKIPNAKTGEVTLTCTTYNGSTAVGTSTTKFTITASEEKCRPTVTAVLIDSNDVTSLLSSGVTGSSKLIKYKSTAKVTPTATVKNSATIKKITVNGTVMSGTYVAFANVQSETFKVEVTDSRGYTNEEYILKPTIIPYIPLSANIEVYRPTDTSSETKVKYNGKFFDGNFGTATNTLTMTWKCTTKQDTSTIVKQGTLTPTKSGNTFSGDVSLGTDFDYQQDYIFTFTIKDKLSTLAPAIPLKRGIPYFDWGIDANGDNYFNINGNLYVDGNNILKQKVLWEDASYMQGNQKATLSEKISEQNHGIILVFSGYSDGEGKNWNWTSQFISKKEVELTNGAGHLFLNGGTQGLSSFKYIYIYDDRLEGNDCNLLQNNTYDNMGCVLRYVIGV